MYCISLRTAHFFVQADYQFQIIKNCVSPFAWAFSKVETWFLFYYAGISLYNTDKFMLVRWGLYKTVIPVEFTIIQLFKGFSAEEMCPFIRKRQIYFSFFVFFFIHTCCHLSPVTFTLVSCRIFSRYPQRWIARIASCWERLACPVQACKRLWKRIVYTFHFLSRGYQSDRTYIFDSPDFSFDGIRRYVFAKILWILYFFC